LYAPTADVDSISLHHHRGNFFHKGKFKAPVVYIAFNKYITMSKILFSTLGNGPADRWSPGPLPSTSLHKLRNSKILHFWVEITLAVMSQKRHFPAP